MPKDYKPERTITSGKLRELISKKFRVNGDNYKRIFKKRLVISRGWVRGYSASLRRNQDYRDVIVILDVDDSKVLDIYMVDDCKREATSLGIEEILTSE